MAYIYRLEQLNEPFVNKVNYGPWHGSSEIAEWAVAKNFYRISYSETSTSFKPPNRHGVDMLRRDVCGVRSYKELNDWFPNRFKRREPFRVVKYYANEDDLIDLPDQVVIDAKRLKQVAVLEMFG